MKRLFILLGLALLLSACGSQKPDPNPNLATWDSAKWNESKWEK